MGISYKVYFKNREGSSSSTIVYVAYQTVEENKECDLCELLRRQLLDHFQMTNDEKYPFRYGSLVVCLVFYFLNALPGNKNVIWRKDMTIGAQFKEYLDKLDDNNKACCKFFMDLQKEMIIRNKIFLNIVDWYRDEITFMVDKDNCFIQVLVLCTSWVSKISYEVSKDECMNIVEILLKLPKDLSKQRFGMFDEIMGNHIGNTEGDAGMTSNGCISKVKRTKKLSTSFVEASSSVPKLLKSKHMGLVEKEIADAIVVESDEGESKKVIVEEDVEKDERLVSSPTSSREISLEVDKVIDLIRHPNGLKDTNSLYLTIPMYDQEVIKQALVTYMLQNNLVPDDVTDLLPKVLVEILIECMALEDANSSDSKSHVHK